MNFQQYLLYSYSAATFAAIGLLIYAARRYAHYSDTRLLQPFRPPQASLSASSRALYDQLLLQLDSQLEILCNVPVQDTLPAAFSRQLTQPETFTFVICERRSGKIHCIAEGIEQSTAEKVSLCQQATIRYICLTTALASSEQTVLPPVATQQQSAPDRKIKRRYPAQQSPFARHRQREYKKVITKI